MADWYLSSTAYAAVPTWTASTAVTVGTFVRATAPTANNLHVFRCSTAGTTGATEPSWSLTKNANTTDGTAVWTAVTGESTYGWSAAAGNLNTLTGVGTAGAYTAGGDRVFASSDHSESNSATLSLAPSLSTIGTPAQIVSVNKAGSVPPAAADYLAGASFASSADVRCDYHTRFHGLTISAGGNIMLNYAGTLPLYLKDCALKLTGTGATYITNGNPCSMIVLENTTVQFNATSQGFKARGGFAWRCDWRNTPNAIQGTVFPTTLFQSGSSTGSCVFTARGVDLSALGSTTTLFDFSTSIYQAGNTYQIVNCKLGASVVVASAVSAATAITPVAELINCDSGSTNYRNERYMSAGSVVTETSIVLSGGASDGTTAVSRKMVSSVAAEPLVNPLEGFPMAVWNDTVGVSKTATVQIISSGTLTNQDIWLELEYLGDGTSPRETLATSYPAELAAATNLPTSAATWLSSPSTPVAQSIALTFTPQQKGWVRGVLKLGKASTTVYANPQLALA